MKDFLTALGLVFVIEGTILTLMPERIKGILKYMETYPPDTLRKVGFASVVVGGIWVWVITH